ncbi:hypothetical protein SOVF_060540 [Spinacia oleracea]|uniref:Nuclear transport factor 2 n=1 Tax=Spinacia oleracea TaxID=3562 RepID=A0A9R0JH97_SPIOL|nr:nuclear transport factor 2-like [Spinacia oleracea]KNA19557.1 hypothetical protein SOVF_060540 [Spinacia oleracea]
MAAQTDVCSSDLSAETVGHAFVGQFYQILHQNPELVYRFYQDSSTMSRPGPDGTLSTVTSMEGIKELMLSLDCEDYKAEILTADAQASYMNGVIVLVTGRLTGKDYVRRNFTESFFLAPQDKGFFVLNDTFRFVEEDSSPEVNSVVEKDVDTSAPAAPVIPIEETTKASDVTVNHAPAVEDVTETVSISKDEPKSTVEKAVPQASADVVQPVAETLQNGHVDAPKKSYASLLKNLSEGAIKTTVPRLASATKAANLKASQKSVAPSPAVQPTRPAPVSTAVPKSSAPSDSNGNFDVQAEETDHSVYIGYLPLDATVAQVENEFKRFGAIKNNGIQVRSNKGFCFGFVEYEDATGKQNAIDCGHIIIGENKAFIQKKKTPTKVINGVSMYPAGRNGYRNNDSFKGRSSNYSNGGGGRNNYVRNNNNEKQRNGEVPSRGNNRNNGDGNVYQNGAGRGSRQGPPSK